MTDRTSVPCNGCTACCRNGEIILLYPADGDDPAQYDHVEISTPHGIASVLRHKPNGDCVYLGENGCTIYQRAPRICRHFDCRMYFLSMNRNQRRLFEKLAKVEIFAAARKRLSTLSDADRDHAINRRAVRHDH